VLCSGKKENTRAYKSKQEECDQEHGPEGIVLFFSVWRLLGVWHGFFFKGPQVFLSGKVTILVSMYQIASDNGKRKMFQGQKDEKYDLRLRDFKTMRCSVSCGDADIFFLTLKNERTKFDPF